MVHTRRPLGVGFLQLDEGVLADLHVCGNELAILARLPERLAESHLLRVERERIGNARNAEPHMVDVHLGPLLRDRSLNGEPDQQARDEEHDTAHKHIPFSPPGDKCRANTRGSTVDAAVAGRYSTVWVRVKFPTFEVRGFGVRGAAFEVRGSRVRRSNVWEPV